MSNIPITPGSGAASVAAETVGGLSYQKIEMYGRGGASVLAINPDGSAQVSIVGTLATTITGSPSISGAVTVVGTPSVSGTVNIGDIKQSVFGASIIGTVPVNVTNAEVIISGSVDAWLETTNASVITVAQGSVGAMIIGGSITAVTTPVTNQSVSGAVGASIIGLPPVNLNVGGAVVSAANPVPVQPPAIGFLPVTNVGSIITVAQSSVAVAIVSGSIATSPAANQSVSGSVGASVLGHAPVYIVGGSILGTPVANQSVSGTVNVGNLPTTQNVSGSVVATQGTNPWIITGSVQGSFTPAANQSVSGTVGASIIGTVPVVQSGIQITSIVSSIPSSVLVGASIFGQLPSGTAVLGSVATLQGTNPWIITGSVQGSFSPAANQSVSGTVGASVIGTIPVVQSGTQVTSIVSTVPSSVLFGASIFGQLPAGTAPLGSVAVLQGTNPWVNTHIGSIITVEKSSSIIAINAGSVIAIPGDASFIGYWDKTPSIVGTYAEDAAHATGASGLFVMQVRNDTMSSITSADGDYSPIGGGPIGETIVANSPITKWVQGSQNLSTNAGASVAVIAAQGASIFTYITGVQLANMGSASVLVTLSGATSSVIAYSIAPAGGGSNIIYRNPIKTNQNGAFTASISGQASVYISAQGFISKT